MPRPIHTPPHPPDMERAHLAARVPARDERDVVPAAAPPEGRARHARRLLHARLQPGLDEPRRLLAGSRRSPTRRKIGLHVALTPTWSETAFFADYVLPMGHRLRAPRHPLLRDSTTASGSASASRCCARRASGSGEPVTDTREVNPGEVWEENEFWIELSWRIDPDGALGIRTLLRVEASSPGEKLTRRRVLRLHLRALRARACPSAPRAEGLTPLEYMRRYGAFEIATQGRRAARGAGARRTSSTTCASTSSAASTRAAPKPAGAEHRAAADARPRRRGPAARRRRGRRRRSCAASRRRAGGSSSTRARSPSGAGPSTRCPTYIRSHVHPDEPRARADGR